MRERAAVDERGRDHRRAHSRRREAVELLVDPGGIAQRQVGDGVEPAPAVADNRLAPPVPRPHVRAQGGQRQRRVQMAAENVTPMCGRCMTQRERRIHDDVAEQVDAERGIGQRAIVIAADRGDFQSRMPRSPGIERMPPRRGMRGAVQYIAEHPQRRGATRRQYPVEPLQVIGSAAAGHRDAGAAEHIVLAQVQVGDQQTIARRPVQRAVRVQAHRFASDEDVEFTRHGGVRAAGRRAARASSSPRC